MPYPYKGKRLTEKALSECQDVSYCMGLSGSSKFCAVDALDFLHLNPCRYINGARTSSQHRKINSAWVQERGQVQNVTLKKVAKGQELIVDYGCQYWVLYKHNVKMLDICKRRVALKNRLSLAKTMKEKARVHEHLIDLQIEEEELVDDLYSDDI